jgi:hypothetical protein
VDRIPLPPPILGKSRRAKTSNNTLIIYRTFSSSSYTRGMEELGFWVLLCNQPRELIAVHGSFHRGNCGSC